MREGDIDLQVMPFVSGLLALDFARPSLRRMMDTVSPLAVGQKARQEDYQKCDDKAKSYRLCIGCTAVEMFERITSFIELGLAS